MPVFTRLDYGDLVCVLARKGVIFFFFRMGLAFGFLSWSREGSCEGGVSRVWGLFWFAPYLIRIGKRLLA